MQCEQFEHVWNSRIFKRCPSQRWRIWKRARRAAHSSLILARFIPWRSEIAAEPVAPLPEHIWISLRNQLEAEGLIRDPEAPVRRTVQAGLPDGGPAFQRPALAGAFLGLALVLAGALGFLSNSQSSISQSALAPVQDTSSVPSANGVFKEEVLNVNDDAIAGLQRAGYSGNRFHPTQPAHC